VSVPRRAASLLGVLLSLAAGGCAPAPVGTFGSWQPTAPATTEVAALEHDMFELINRERAAAGLAALEYDERLADIARAHSLDMKRHDFFAHRSPTTGMLEDRMDRAGYLATEMRENLAMAADIRTAAANLLASPGHRANLLAPGVTHVGVGLVHGSGSGDPRELTITEAFAKPAALDTPTQAMAGARAAANKARQRAGLGPLAKHAMLAELVAQQLAALPDDVPASAVDDISDRVAHALDERGGHGLTAVSVAAQSVFNAGELRLPAAATDPAVRYLELAAAAAHDARGRPRVKILLLFGRTAGQPNHRR